MGGGETAARLTSLNLNKTAISIYYRVQGKNVNNLFVISKYMRPLTIKLSSFK